METNRTNMDLNFDGRLDDRFFEILGKYTSGVATTKDMLDMAQYIVDMIEPSQKVTVCLEQNPNPGQQGAMQYNAGSGKLKLSDNFVEEVINKQSSLRQYLAIVCHEMRHFYQNEIGRKMESGDDQVKAAIDEYSKKVAGSLSVRYLKDEDVDLIFQMLAKVGFQTPFMDYTDEMKKAFAAKVAFSQYAEVRYEKDARSIMRKASMDLLQKIVNDERCPLWVSSSLVKTMLNDNPTGYYRTFSYGQEFEDLFSNFYDFMDKNLEESLPLLENLVQKLYMDESLNTLNTQFIEKTAEENCLRIVLGAIYSDKSNEDLLDAYIHATVSGCKLLGDALIPIIMQRTTKEEIKETQERIVKFLKSDDATRNSYIINHSKFLTQEQYSDVLKDLLSKERFQQIKSLLDGDKEYHEGFYIYGAIEGQKLPRDFIEDFSLYMKNFSSDCKRKVPKHSLSNSETLLDIVELIKQDTSWRESLSISGYKKMLSIARNLMADKGIGKKVKSRLSDNDFRAKQEEMSKNAYSEQYTNSVKAHDKHIKELYDQKVKQDDKFEALYTSKQMSEKEHRNSNIGMGIY